jgi:hypothetical protein
VSGVQRVIASTNEAAAYHAQSKIEFNPVQSPNYPHALAPII